MIVLRLLCICAALLLAGCATTPPKNPDNICSIFKDKDDWYDAALKSKKRWGTPIHVQMAIMHQESRFIHDAKPPRESFLGIPLWRKSSAYGYAQVKDDTWDWYKEKAGGWGADRDEFEDAIDFVGWYTYTTHKMLGISKWDAKNQYLAYHEGHGGYKRRTYRSKGWLINVANKVDSQARRYSSQLKGCESSLDSGWF